MSTSGSTDFSVTRDDIIKDILIELGVLAIGGTPKSDHVTLIARRLNMLVKSWSNYGCQAFTRKTKQITSSLTQDKATYTVGESGADITMERPVKIVGGYVTDTNGDDFMLQIITRDEYESLYDKDTGGQPYRLYYEPYSSNEGVGSPYFGKIYLWPVTDATTAGWGFSITYTRPIEDFDSSTDVPDVPQSWYQALFRVGVVELAPAFGREATKDMTGLASDAFRRAVGQNRELTQQPMFGWPNGPEPKWEW